MPRAQTFARSLLSGFSAIAVAAAVALDARQTAPPPDLADTFTVRDEMIRARDGVKLFRKIFTPKNQTGPLPIVSGARPTASTARPAPSRALQGAGG